MANTDRYYVKNEPVEPRQMTVEDLVKECRFHGVPFDAVIRGVSGLTEIHKHPDGSYEIVLETRD